MSQLAEYVQGMASSAEESHGAWLVQAVDIAPPAGINTLIITLTPNIVGAFGRDTAGIRAGEVLVFRAEPGHPARLLGRITVERLAGLGRHP